MKRDMDLVRKILFAVEAREARWEKLEIEGHSFEEVGYHCCLLIDAGLALGVDQKLDQTPERTCRITSLTNAGHDWLDAAREDTRWKQAKSIFATMGGVTLDVAKSILKQLMTEQASRLLGSG